MVNFDDSLIGKCVDGRYLITAPLGVGGMGTAYKATQIDFGRSVCVKFLKGDFLSDTEAVARFKREARVMGTLRHKNIVECFAFGLYMNVYPYLVMEFIAGTPLSELAKTESLSWPRVCLIVAQVCDALSYAHHRGFVHRDVKPQNVMITDLDGDDHIKVVDFGLVGKNQGELLFDTLTDPGSILGTVNYMPPEAFRGPVKSPTCDVYAVGCLLYEMLSGNPPFDADNSIAVMYKHSHERLPELPKHIAAEPIRNSLEQVIWTATSVDPSDRFAGCDEIADLLRELVVYDPQALGDVRPLELRTAAAKAKRPVTTSEQRISKKIVLTVATVLLAISPGLFLLKQPPTMGPSAVETMLASRNGKSFNGGDSQEYREALSNFQLLSHRLELLERSRNSQSSVTFAKQADGLLRSLQACVERDGGVLKTNGDGTELARHVCRQLSRLSENLPANSQTLVVLIMVQQNIVGSFGFYRDFLTMLKSDAPLSLAAEFRIGNAIDFEVLHKYVFDEHVGDNDSLVYRLRSAAAGYQLLTDNGAQYQQFLNSFHGLHTPDVYTPSLFDIWSKIDSSASEQSVSRLLLIGEIENTSKNSAAVDAITAIIAQRLPKVSLSLTTRYARFLSSLDRFAEAQATIERGLAIARRRGSALEWCSLQVVQIEVLLKMEKKDAAAAAAANLTRCPQWTKLKNVYRHDVSMRSEFLGMCIGLGRLCNSMDKSREATELFNLAWEVSSTPVDLEMDRRTWAAEYASILWKSKREEDSKNIAASCVDTVRRHGSFRLLAEQCSKWSAWFGSAGLYQSAIDLGYESIRAYSELAASSSLNKDLAEKRILEEQNSIAGLLSRSGDVRSARRLYQAMLCSVSKSANKSHDEQRLQILFALRDLQRTMGLFRDAEETSFKIIDQMEQKSNWTAGEYGQLFDVVIVACSNAAAYTGLDNVKEFLLKKSLAFQNSNPRIYCYLMLHLARVYMSLDHPEWNEAKSCANKVAKVLAVLPPPRGDDYTIHVVTITMLGQIQAGLEETDKAAATYLRGIEDCKRSGAFFLEQVDLYCSYADMCSDLGDSAKALALLRDAEAVNRAPEFDRILRVNRRKAMILALTGKSTEAIALLGVLEKGVEKLASLDERELWTCFTNLWYYQVFSAGKRSDEAAARILSAYLIFRKGEKRHNPQLNANLANAICQRLARSSWRARHYDQAYQQLEALQAMLQDKANKKLWGERNCNHEYALSLIQMADFYHMQRREGEAISCLQKAMVIDSRLWLKGTLILAEAKAGLGDQAGALSAYRQCLDRVHSPLSPADVDKAWVLTSYSCWLHDRGQTEEAERYAEDALSVVNIAKLNDSDIYAINLQRMRRWYRSKNVQKLDELISRAEMAS